MTTQLHRTDPDYMTTEELADRLRTSASTIRYYRHIGKGPASFKVGRRVLYPAAAVDAWLASLQAAQDAE